MLFDYIMYCLVIGVFFAIGLLMKIPILEDYTSMWVYILFTGGLSIITFSYCISFLYKSSVTVNHAFGWINYFGLFTSLFLIGFLSGVRFINQILVSISPFFAMV